MDDQVIFQPVFPSAAPFISFLFTGTAVHALFYLSLVLYGIASAILLYHWLRYNVGIFRTAIVIAAYGVGSFILLAASYSASLLF